MLFILMNVIRTDECYSYMMNVFVHDECYSKNTSYALSVFLIGDMFDVRRFDYFTYTCTILSFLNMIAHA